jgi:hypothetical protein
MRFSLHGAKLIRSRLDRLDLALANALRELAQTDKLSCMLPNYEAWRRELRATDKRIGSMCVMWRRRCERLRPS